MKNFFPVMIIGIFIFSGLNAVGLNEVNIFQIEKECHDTHSFNGPEEEWNKTYGGMLNDFFRSGIQLDGNNYVVNGVQGITSSNDNSSSMLLTASIDSTCIIKDEQSFHSLT